MVNDVAETKDQEMGSGISCKTDDEGTKILCMQNKFIQFFATVQIQIATSNVAFIDIIESKEKVHYSRKGLCELQQLLLYSTLCRRLF